MEEPEPMDLDSNDDKAAPPMMVFEGVRGEDAISSRPTMAFRRRIGRNNRLWIDRRGFTTPPRETTAGDSYSDRWKYDNDDSDDEQPVYEVDPYDTRALKYRAGIPLYSRRLESSANGVIHVNGTGAGGRTAPQTPQQKSSAAT